MTIETGDNRTARGMAAATLARAQLAIAASTREIGRHCALYARATSQGCRRWYGRRTAAVVPFVERYVYGTLSRILFPFMAPIGRALRGTWPMQWISRTLLRRIVASNLLGLMLLLGGLTYLTQFNSWLIDAKIEHLRAQSHILAAAIASKATLSDELDEKAGGDRTLFDPLRDNPFAALEFSIQPEIVVPLLPTLLEKTAERGRVYDVSGVLIADSAQILRPGSIIPIKPGGKLTGHKPKTENIWTRLTQWLMSSDLRVYKDIGSANGRLYPEVQAALEGKSTALMLLARKRSKIVSVATPIMRGDKVRGALLLSTAPGAIDDVLGEELFAVFVLVLGATVAAMLASYLLARTVAEPVSQLSQYANEVTHDIKAAKEMPRFDERADEVGQLARSFELMTRALYRRIEASEKFAADVAHELKNPLTAARATAESLIYAKTDQQRDDAVEQIQLELKRLNKLISDVSDASRLDADLALQRFEPVLLTAVVRDVAGTFRDLPVADGRTIAISIDPEGNDVAFVVLGQDGRLEQVLTNLLANALSFTPKGGTVVIKLRRQPGHIDMSVEDQGPGIEPDNIEKIFARFYTYRPTANSSRGENSGLGLAISREIIEAHDGRVWAENIWQGETSGVGGKQPAARPTKSADQPPPKPLGARFIVRLPAGPASTKRGRLSGGR